jgi:thermitase
MKNGMKNLVVLTSATVTALTMVGCGQMAPSAQLAGANSVNFNAAAAPGEIIVKFKNEQSRQALLQNLGLKTVKKVERINAIVVKGANTKAAITKLQADPNVVYAEPNYVAKAFDIAPKSPAFGFDGLRGGDELLEKLWGMAKIEAAAAWAVTRGGGDVKVAVVDTGVDWKHADFGGRVEKGRDFINNDDDAMDDHYHGTHCAGTIGAGMGNGGVVGVAPEVKMIAVKVLSGSGSGSYEGVANGIIYSADQGAQIISMSLGGPAGSKVIEDAVNYAKSKGSLVVAAMGNDNSERPSYPASAPGVMAVGSTTSADIRSSFSNYGKHISVGAPGSDIVSTVPGGKYKSLSGTSMATPHAAGLVALIKTAFPNAAASELQSRAEKSADDLGEAGFDKYFGHGRINARKAVTQ